VNEAVPTPLKTLLMTAHAVEERLECALGPVGLSLAKFKVLAQLVAAGEPLPLRALADMSSCVRSNITQLMDRLESERLVVRADDPRDRRSIRAELTAEGRARHASAAKALDNAEREIFSGLSAARRETLLELLGSLQVGTVSARAR
jgi:DNA-binding MarR family transcriptional regulator